ncbi:MAG: hypothetical protein ACJASF_001057 [Vicingaceae bacterium]|jgi:hypothetical protein
MKNRIKSILQAIMKSKMSLILSLLTLSCTNVQEKVDKKQELTDLRTSYHYTEIVLEITQKEQAAFDALNTLQTSTDEMNRLYSTFANIDQPCYPADTSFEVSQSELLIFMEQFISKHCQNLTPEIQNQLAKTSVLAQKKYTVLHCTGNKSNVTNEKGLPMTGTWVMPNVLGRRDVILVW